MRLDERDTVTVFMGTVVDGLVALRSRYALPASQTPPPLSHSVCNYRTDEDAQSFLDMLTGLVDLLSGQLHCTEASAVGDPFLRSMRR